MGAEAEEIESVFESREIHDIWQEIQEVYLQDDRPWIIGYSGGKDSTATAQLVWQAVGRLPAEKRSKPVYVICSDTMVETPIIVDHINKNIERINEEADEKDLPFTGHKVMPKIKDSFWTKLIGEGYPAPQSRFRWCTDRMKIKPADEFILNKVSEHGEVIVVLGARKAESMSRAQVMEKRSIQGTPLSSHSSLPNVLVYTPIEDWTTEDVWTYLLQMPSPWGANNRDLAAMYQTADGECPLVIDSSTPSCGNSRFGCWTCTVVEKDKSMEAAIDEGEEWMEPLLKFRDFLAETQDPERKKEVRRHKRKVGTIQTKDHNDDELVRGPYRLDFCKELLRGLLKTQEEVREKGPDPEMDLIKPGELHEIRRIWRFERGDWEDSVPEIYEDVTGETLDWVDEDLDTGSEMELALLKEVAREHDLPVRLLTKLIDTEREYQGMKYRSRVYKNLKTVLREDWRSEEEVLRQLEEGTFHTDEALEEFVEDTA